MSPGHSRISDPPMTCLGYFHKTGSIIHKNQTLVRRLAQQSELLMIGLESAHEANVTMVTDESSVHYDGPTEKGCLHMRGYMTKEFLQTFHISLNKDFIKCT